MGLGGSHCLPRTHCVFALLLKFSKCFTNDDHSARVPCGLQLFTVSWKLVSEEEWKTQNLLENVHSNVLWGRSGLHHFGGLAKTLQSSLFSSLYFVKKNPWNFNRWIWSTAKPKLISGRKKKLITLNNLRVGAFLKTYKGKTFTDRTGS